MSERFAEFCPLRWQDDCLWLLDQRRLPAEERWLRLRSAAQVAVAIRNMAVRGAPLIGIAAAYGMALSARRHARRPPPERRRRMRQDRERLAAARPTAVNLAWALARMQGLSEDNPEAWLAEARAIHAEDLVRNRRMGELGSALIAPGSRVLTHCNTGALATGGYGTALGVIRRAWRAGKLQRIFVTETRPWLQGARLSAWELARDGIPATLIADGAAAAVMAQQGIAWVIVGADRIAANGDVANKIGTYALALAAHRHGARLMVVAPASSVDMDMVRGADIPIEERGAAELLQAAGWRQPPASLRVLNPVFDITPAEQVDALVTERGVVLAPDTRKMVEVFENSRKSAAL